MGEQKDAVEMNKSCLFCSNRTEPKDYVGSRSYWRVLINRNQNYLGKTMLMLRRHETDVTALTAEEQMEFWQLLADVRKALGILFQPDHFNYAFLMNQDAHVHLHVIPRYKASRDFVGLTFVDEHYGDHYQLTENLVPIEIREKLAEELRTRIPNLAY